MTKFRLILISLLLTLLLWGAISWPLPIYTFTGIPASADNVESQNVRTMISGDHLQFLYHMWLAKDTFFGPTKLFYNSYEFNTGDEEERKDPAKKYYFPFTLVFSLFAGGGHALGWNATGFVTLWLTFLFTWMLARRYTKSQASAITAAVISIILPYRWIALLGGSPTGLAMMWVPMAFYGLDVMVRDRKLWAAALAGAAIYFSGWCDPHVMFFSTLAAPCWCIIAYLHGNKTLIPSKQDVRQILIAAIPFMIAAVFIARAAQGTEEDLGDTVLNTEKRPWHEIMVERIPEISLFSPHLRGTVDGDLSGKDRQIYIGWLLIILLGAGLTATALRTYKKEVDPVKVLLPSALLLCGIGGIIILSAGVNNPWGTMFWLRLCKLLKPYGMIRQPAKIFIILPVMLGIASAITLPSIIALLKLKSAQKWIYSSIVILLTLNYTGRIDPTICRLDNQQKAYEAVAKDAKKNSSDPHIICIPIWPGNSHWTSVNQHYISLYRIRMINGYRPTRREAYVKDVYERFESFNKGGYSDEQLDNLLQRGIQYIVVHEDAFPEKVSPFSASHTVYQLLAHPRIKFLAKDGAAWSFKITTNKDGVYADLPDWNHKFPARLWQFDRNLHTNAIVMKAGDTSGGKYLRLPNSNSSASTQTYPSPSLNGLCYLIRTRGGAYTAEVTIDKTTSSFNITPPSTNEWSWQRIPIAATNNYQVIQLKVTPSNTQLDADLAILATDDWDFTKLDTVTIPAPVFFHAGYTDIDTGEVVLSPDREPADVIFYGPKLPLPKGSYHISIDYSTDAEDGTLMGVLRSRYSSRHTPEKAFRAGEPAEFTYNNPSNLRLAMDLKYSRKAVLRIKSVTIRKVRN